MIFMKSYLLFAAHKKQKSLETFFTAILNRVRRSISMEIRFDLLARKFFIKCILVTLKKLYFYSKSLLF